MIWKLRDPSYTAELEFAEPDSDWLARMISKAPDPEQFHAGRMHSHVVLLDKFFEETSNRTGNANKVRHWIRHGIRLPFVNMWHKSQQQAAHYDRNVKVVRRMLAKAVGPSNVDAYLQGSKPSRVKFPNHQSAHTYSSFVEAKIAKGISKGVMAEWPFPDPPTVTNGIKVVDTRPDKLRFCINPMYINLFVKHEPVQYEKLQDLQDLIKPEDFMSSSDDKSGYWQLDMHPDMWQFLGFEWKGKYYCFKVLAFGVTIACWIYTTIKAEIFRPLRALGSRLQFLIDDRCFMHCPYGKLSSRHLSWLY